MLQFSIKSKLSEISLTNVTNLATLSIKFL